VDDIGPASIDRNEKNKNIGMTFLDVRAHNLFVPNESTKEGISKSAITIGTKGQNRGDEGSILSNSRAL